MQQGWIATSVVVWLALALAPAVASAQGAGSAARGAALGSAQRASDVVRAIERHTSRVQHLLGEQRAAGDATRAACVDARLSEISATLRLAIERANRATRYQERGDGAMAERERALIARLASRARELERDARGCVDPEGEIAPGRTRVTVIIDPSVPRDAIEDPADRRGTLAFR